MTLMFRMVKLHSADAAITCVISLLEEDMDLFMCSVLLYTFIHRGFHALQILFVLFHQVPSQLSHVYTVNVFVLVVSVGMFGVVFCHDRWFY